MLKVIEEKHVLILRDFPVVPVLSGLGMVSMSLLFIWTLYDFTMSALSAGDYDWIIFVPPVFSAFLIIFGIYTLVSAPVITTTINRQTKSLTIEKRSLLKNEFDQYKFDQLERYLSLKTGSYKGTDYYTPQIQLKTHDTIDLISHGLTNRGKSYDIVDLANKYLADESEKDNFKLTILNDD
jgi:hypothetical protein